MSWLFVEEIWAVIAFGGVVSSLVSVVAGIAFWLFLWLFPPQADRDAPPDRPKLIIGGQP